MQIENLSLSFGMQIIFDNVSINIPSNSKVGIVGVNGAGKTTLFNLICGQITPNSGKIKITDKKRIELLPQVISEDILKADKTVMDFLTDGRPIKKLENNLQKLYNQLATCPLENQEKISTKINKTLQKLEYWNYYEADTILLKIIEGMQIDPNLLDSKIASLSGGQKSKVAFAKLLYSNPEIILLDEPTNHLDQNTKDYVINYLKKYKGSVYVISHDIDFLNQVVDKILYLDKATHTMKVYNGNYQKFIKQKEAFDEALIKQAKIQSQEEKKLKDIINKYSNSSGKLKKMAQDREKKLEKLLKNKIEIAPSYKQVKFKMEINQNSANIPLKINNLSFRYDKNSSINIIDKLSLDIYRGEKFLIVGENGVGKSTLLKLLVGVLTPDEGSIEKNAKTSIGYYAQEHDLLDNTKTILDNFQDTNISMNKLRGILGNFLFTEDTVYKKVGILSPGEKSRVALAKLAVMGANMLLLDEPTNHLDPQTQKIIGEVFKTYPGTMLVVSHNPDFVDTLGIERILLLPEGKITYYNKEIVEYFHKENNKGE